MFALHCLLARLSTMPKLVNKSYLMILLLLVVNLSACTHFEQRGNESQSTKTGHWLYGEAEQHKEAMKLLNRFKTLDSLPANQLKAAHKSAERTFRKQPTTSARLQLAWLLAMKNTSFQDIPRAAKLLIIKRKSKNQEKPSKALNDLAYFIRRMVEEQKFQQDRYRRVVKALDKEQKTSRKLATKIEDLTQIEESMIQRKPLPKTELK